MPAWAPRNPPPRASRATTTAASLILLITGCSTNTDRTSAPMPPTPQPSTVITASSPSPAAPRPSTTDSTTPTNADSPETTAIRWLISYRSADWTDQLPTAWIDRVRPYVTDAMNTANETLRNGVGGTDWAEFVRQHCSSTLTDTTAVIPAESPGTNNAANVQVTGTIHTACAAGSPANPTESVAATLVVIKTGSGWRVDRRLF